MPVLQSSLNPRSAEFQANAQAMQALVDDLRQQQARVSQGGGEAARAKHTARGKLLPRERVQQLLDPGSPFLEVAPLAALNMYGNDAPAAGRDSPRVNRSMRGKAPVSRSCSGSANGR